MYMIHESNHQDSLISAEIMDSGFSCGKKAYQEKLNVSYRFLVCPLILYTIIILLTMKAKYGIFTKRQDSDNSEDGVELKSSARSITPRMSLPNYCELSLLSQTCMVTCQDSSVEILGAELNRLNFSTCQVTPSMNLVLRNISFTEGSIKEGWLSNCSTEVEKLEIYSSAGLYNIGDAAFAGQPFAALKYLVIDGSSISNLRKNTFLGSELVDLEIRFEASRNFEIESGVLEPLATTLSTFQLNHGVCTPDAIKKLTGTGTNTLTALSVLDLQYNTLEDIADDSFIDIKSLVSLYLSDNHIKSIGKRAFSGLGHSLQLLMISNNEIKTMEEGIFDGFTRSGRIQIKNNPWKCDCALNWMKHYYIEHMESHFANGTEPFLCEENGVYKNYTEVDFCPISSSPSSESTEPISATTVPSISTTTIINDGTTAFPSSLSTTSRNIPSSSTTPATIPSTTSSPNKVNFSCEYLENNILPLRESGYSRMALQGNASRVIYDMENIEDTPFYAIQIENALPRAVLLWINSLNHKKYGCIDNIYEKIKLDALEYSQSYLLCLLNDSGGEVDPFDCTTLVVPPKWGARTWIPNESKNAVIGGIIGVIVVAIVLTIVIVSLTVEKNPRIMRKYRKYMVNQNFLLEKSTPSLYTMSDGYLIPNFYEPIISSPTSSELVEYDTNEEVPPLPPVRSFMSDPSKENNCRFSQSPEEGKSSRISRDCSFYRKHPNYHATRSMSVPGERICSVFVF